MATQHRCFSGTRPAAALEERTTRYLVEKMPDCRHVIESQRIVILTAGTDLERLLCGSRLEDDSLLFRYQAASSCVEYSDGRSKTFDEYLSMEVLKYQ